MEKSNIISTSDSRICFKSEDYITHKLTHYYQCSELLISVYSLSNPIKIEYSNSSDAIKFSKEIIDQLKQNENPNS